MVKVKIIETFEDKKGVGFRYKDPFYKKEKSYFTYRDITPKEEESSNRLFDAVEEGLKSEPDYPEFEKQVKKMMRKWYKDEL